MKSYELFLQKLMWQFSNDKCVKEETFNKNFKNTFDKNHDFYSSFIARLLQYINKLEHLMITLNPPLIYICII